MTIPPAADSNIINSPQNPYFIALQWTGGSIRLLDQRLLPNQEVYIEIDSPQAVAHAIKTMQLRGAPLIGIAAAFGLALAALYAPSVETVKSHFLQAKKLLAATRPTARNLFWALERMSRTVDNTADESALPDILLQEALAIQQEDFQACRAIGDFGARLLPDEAVVLTHCNAGALATAGWGTALGVIRSAVEQGKRISVIADETRPLLQGSRLTAWELTRENIPVTVISDSAAGSCMMQGRVDAVVVGADRIARNGDVVNKIGTYQLAVLAREHTIPFYVAAPLSTSDLSLQDGRQIPIEERNPDEILNLADTRISAADNALNPAFDLTPARFVTAIICEKGVVRPPFDESLPAITK